MTSLLLYTCGLVLLGATCLAIPAVPGNLTDPDYSGYQVLEILTTSDADNFALQTLLASLDDKVDVWGRAGGKERPSVVMVGPDTLPVLVSALDSFGITHKVYIPDVKAFLAADAHGRKRRATYYSYPSQTADSLLQYTRRFNSYDQIMKFLDLVNESKTKKATTELISIGTSFEGRDLRLIKLSNNLGRQAAKPAIFIDAGIHAREWIAPATAINFIYQLAENPRNEAGVREMLEKFDFYILPLLNPDGYEYSRTNNRMWRKNRNTGDSAYCPGVDLNRNFDFHWNPRNGGSSNPCSEIYAGTSPLSEPESRALASFLNSHSATLQLYLTYHSSGQLLLYCWAYTTAPARDVQQLNNLARVASDAMIAYTYNVGSASTLLQSAAGGSDDYAKGVAGIKYSYTVELPPKDINFIIPESQIPLVAESSFEGLMAMTQELAVRMAEPVTAAPVVTTPVATTTGASWGPWGAGNSVWQWWFQWLMVKLRG